jgi:tyrosyl-tRNA synthetase
MSKDNQQQPPAAPAAAPAPAATEWNDELEADLRRILSVGEECISEGELRSLLLAKGRGTESAENDAPASASASAPRIRLYDGFEPSGRMHIAQGLLKSVNVNKCTSPGTHSTFVFWVADWFALMNDKMGGDLHKITIVGRYLIEVWKAAGMDLSNVEFRWASEEINDNAHVYWPIMLDVARRFNVTRIRKCCQIMGRLEGNLTAAQVLYPLMQCTDVFFLKADICQLGVDQRKVNMLAREYSDHAKDKKRRKPVILSHHMLYGLKEGQEKMSKSDPDSAIFMEDGVEDVERKIRSAFCPTAAPAPTSTADPTRTTANDDDATKDDAGDVKEEVDAGRESMHLANDDDSALKNPILDYVRHIVLSPPGSTFACCRRRVIVSGGRTDATPSMTEGEKETTGGEVEERVVYERYDDVKSDFLSGRISPDQLKDGLVAALNELLQPVRDHFETDDDARVLLEQVREFKRTTTTSTTAAGVLGEDAPPKVFRLDLVEAGVVPPSCHLVMAPLPESNPTLQSVADVLGMLRTGGASPSTTTTPGVLMLLDWTARVNSSLDADPKLISAYHAVLLSTLRALDDHLHGGAVMKNVTIVTQSEAILRDPSNYWISVINAGRHFSLDEVMMGGANNVKGGGGGSMKDSEGVGKVIGRLMMVADVLAVNPRSIALFEASGGDDGDDDGAKGIENMSIEEGCNDETAARSVEAHLILQFYSTKLSHPGLASVLPVPRISHVGGTAPSSSAAGGGGRLGLQPPRESAAHRTESDEYYVTDDPKVHGKSKMKKAFCEPGNVGFCPPIELLAYFGGLEGGGADCEDHRRVVTISRSPDNGGDVTYAAKSELVRDFASGALHPGDLKGAVSNMMVEVLTKISAEIKCDDASSKGVKALKAFEKKMAKQKKK